MDGATGTFFDLIKLSDESGDAIEVDRLLRDHRYRIRLIDR
jgi:hypothetical protein